MEHFAHNLHGNTILNHQYLESEVVPDGYFISGWSSQMYAVPHNRQRPPLTFRARTSHEYVKLCRVGVIGVGGLIAPGLYVSQMTDP